jgi:CheY-like chemotaxis protein
VAFRAAPRADALHPLKLAKTVRLSYIPSFGNWVQKSILRQMPALVDTDMVSNPPRRKVLIIEDEPSIRNVLHVLLAGLGYDSDAASDAFQGLSMIRRGEFDAVLLDLRCSQLPPDQMVCAIMELRPSLVGRVLVITGEVSHPKTIEMLERYALPHVSRSRITSELSLGIAQMDGLTSFLFSLG